MKNRKTVKIISIILIVAVLIGVWYIRYTSLQKAYYKDYPPQKITYVKMHEVFDAGVNKYRNIDGYAFEIKDYKIIDSDEFAKQCEGKLAHEYKEAIENNKIALITIEITNPGNCGESLSLNEVQIYSKTNVYNTDLELVNAANPQFEEPYGSVKVTQGKSFTYTIPFILRKNEFKTSTWNNIEDYHFWFSCFTTDKTVELW